MPQRRGRYQRDHAGEVEVCERRRVADLEQDGPGEGVGGEVDGLNG